jgi:hypothetical protein
MSFEAKLGSTGNAAVVKYAAGRSTRAQRYVQKIGRGVQKNQIAAAPGGALFLC